MSGNTGPKPYLNWQELFWAKVVKTETCWIWNGAKSRGVCHFGHATNSRGHATLSWKVTSETLATRVSFWLAFGFSPKGVAVIHRCDRWDCVRPDHLMLEEPRPWREIFWSKVVKTDGCWLWTGAKGAKGRSHLAYGSLWDRKTGNGWARQCRTEIGERQAHRIAWVLTNGPIPHGLFVCHKCDTPPCVRPDHLFLGTHADNMTDMRRKRRHKFGRPNGQCKEADLTPDQIAEIVHCVGKSYRELAAEFGVRKETISVIRRVVKP